MHNANLAEEGRIREDAPITATALHEIEADPERIWEVLTGFRRWPEWMEAVSKVDFEGEVAPGATFKWKANGMTITSELKLVEPHRRIAWTGRMLGTRAIHVWELEPVGEGKTLVKSRESMEGWFIWLILNSDKLEETLQDGLEELRAAAEEG